MKFENPESARFKLWIKYRSGKIRTWYSRDRQGKHDLPQKGYRNLMKYVRSNRSRILQARLYDQSTDDLLLIIRDGRLTLIINPDF